MGENSAISWTDHTHNRWWGCSRVSPGCGDATGGGCYAEAWAKRMGHACFGPNKRRLFGEKHLNEPRKWAAAARAAGKKARVFCMSMGDLLETGHPEVEPARESLWPLIRETADALDWLLLTKRAENLPMIPEDVARVSWIGVTVETRKHLHRIEQLKKTSARVRFVSAEPLLEDLGPIDLGKVGLGGVKWVICGGESGGKARPFDLAWARSLRDQCKAAGISFFFKQTGRDARQGVFPLHNVGDGRDPAEWPEDLRVQEFPEVTP